MERESAIEYLRGQLRPYVESITTKSKGGLYDCPICGSGSGKHGTGAFSITDSGDHWKCFACGAGGDIYDLIGAVENTSGFNERLNRAAEFGGVTIDQEQPRKSTALTYKGEKKAAPAAPAQRQSQSAGNSEKADYTALYTAAREHIRETDYYKRRGLSDEIADYFKLGFIRKWTHPKASGKYPTDRLIIPTSRESYIARLTELTTEENKRYRVMKVGSVHTFNSRALESAAAPVYIVEGEIDALSIMEAYREAGAADWYYRAVALGSTARTTAFLEEIKERHPKAPLFVALDSDEAGQRAAQSLIHGLKELNTPAYMVDIVIEGKDANDSLTANKAAFVERLKATEADPGAAERAAKEAQKVEYQKNSAAEYLQAFINGITESANTPAIPTGFNSLDTLLDGGLYEGLYIMGAVTSLGKTAFCLQLVDQIAAAGYDVLVFSLEMSKNELISRSISRHTILDVLQSGGDARNAKSARGITAGAKWAKYSVAERELIQRAMRAYEQYAGHIYIKEGVGDFGVDTIKEDVERHIELTGNKPVVLIDYLQILAPADMRATDKQNTDKAVLELKRLSRLHKLAIIGISSFNRENYSAAVNMAAFKESGAIEYSSDVLIGLQFKGAGKKGFDLERAKGKQPREIELKILKNRNGRAGVGVNFGYYAIFNYFKEGGIIEETESADREETPAGTYKEKKGKAPAARADIEEDDY